MWAILGKIFFGKGGPWRRQVDYHSLARGGVPPPWKSKAGWDNAGQHVGNMFCHMGNVFQKFGMNRFVNLAGNSKVNLAWMTWLWSGTDLEKKFSPKVASRIPWSTALETFPLETDRLSTGTALRVLHVRLALISDSGNG